jgi:hypothetical protein
MLESELAGANPVLRLTFSPLAFRESRPAMKTVSDSYIIFALGFMDAVWTHCLRQQEASINIYR